MPNPFLLVVFAFLAIAGIAALVIYLLRPQKEDIPPADALNDSRVSGQWAGGLGAGSLGAGSLGAGDDAPQPISHNVIHHDFGGGHTLH